MHAVFIVPDIEAISLCSLEPR